MEARVSAKTIVVAGVRAGFMGGALVGLAEGVRAAAHGQLGAGGVLACVALVVSLDVLVGVAAGAGAGVLAGLAHGGGQAAGRAPARALAWTLVGLAAAAVAAPVVRATAERNNRFLAAGVVTLALLAAGAVGAIAGPALARLLDRFLGRLGRGRREVAPSTGASSPGASPPDAPSAGGPSPLAVSPRPPSPAGVLLAAPIVAALLAAPVFYFVWHARPPLPRGVLGGRAALVAAVAAILPWTLARLATIRWRLPLPRAAAIALAAFGVPAGLLVRARWMQDFQFLRWHDMATGGAILAAVAALLFRARRRTTRSRRPWLLPLAAAPAAAIVVLVAGASEGARKAAAAHAGLSEILLSAATRALDLDRDGYARLLGGGDCDDRDPAVHPGAEEWPEDGVDDDCDGRDASAAGLAAPPLHPVPDAVPKDLNILFVTIDALRADHVGAYGYGRPTTPVLDRLAAEGTVFDSSWAHAPSTRYSMPAIATGRWPSAIEWDESIWWPRFTAGQATIGEALGRHGYFTAAFFAYLYFNRADARGFERGIDLYDDRRAALHVNTNGPMESSGTSAREMADDGIAFLDAYKDRKFFLWLHFYDPHLDYERHAGAPDFGARPVDLYDGEVWFTDQQLGRVLDRVRAHGLWDRTAVLVTGDHGEGFGERGIAAHGYHLYAAQTRVPFIARVPGLAPRRVEAPVGHVDLAPTLLNLARGAREPSFLGRSMLDLMATGAPSPSVPAGPVFQEVTYEGPVKRRALAGATHHLIWNWVPAGTTECYHLAGDPMEEHDLWGTPAASPACPRLKDDLGAMMAALSVPPGFREKLSRGVSRRGAPSPAPRHALGARFGSAVRFIGYDVARAGAPAADSGAPAGARVQAGGSVEVTCHFESLERLDGGWRPFFHLDGPGGFRNLDHVPVEGTYPLERWRPGDRVRDRMSIHFSAGTPAGTYTLSVGIFRGVRLPVTPRQASDGQDRLRVLAIEVFQ